MSSPFMYRLRIMSSKKDKGVTQNNFPIYAFKSGGEKASWYAGAVDLSIVRGILENADTSTRLLTVSTSFQYAYRALINMDVLSFSLSVLDKEYKPTKFNEPRKTLFIAECGNMWGGEKISAYSTSMSFESPYTNLVSVTLELLDGGFSFTKNK